MPIQVEHLSYTYSKKTPYEKQALRDVSFTLRDGECVGLVGSTGSGKSTLAQHLNGLIKLTEGKIVVDDVDLSARKPDLVKLRKNIGMLFQYPEYQLFADTVLDDVKFGPLNFGMTKEEAQASAEQAIRAVGLNYDEIKDRSPIDLSGGQKRRVAVAGVLSYRPSILILDEPTAGLDPLGKRDMLNLVTSLRKSGMVKTVVMVSHNMDEIAEYTDRVLVLKKGELACDETPREFFYTRDVTEFGLALPHAVHATKLLEEKGIVLDSRPLTRDEFINALKAYPFKKEGADA